MLYLPLHHPVECLAMIEELGGKPGVAGCVVASPRYEKVQSKGMMRVFSAMEERGLVLAFHGMANWEEPSLAGDQPLGRGAGARRAALQHDRT